jgi:hypothetical protein
MPQFYPLALLHAIAVEFHYATLAFSVDAWRRNAWAGAATAKALSAWRVVHYADVHLRETIAELARVMREHPNATPQVAKGLSARN